MPNFVCHECQECDYGLKTYRFLDSSGESHLYLFCCKGCFKSYAERGGPYFYTLKYKMVATEAESLEDLNDAEMLFLAEKEDPKSTFVKSVAGYFERNGKVTEKQREVLLKIIKTRYQRDEDEEAAKWDRQVFRMFGYDLNIF